MAFRESADRRFSMGKGSIFGRVATGTMWLPHARIAIDIDIRHLAAEHFRSNSPATRKRSALNIRAQLIAARVCKDLKSAVGIRRSDRDDGAARIAQPHPRARKRCRPGFAFALNAWTGG